MRRLDKVVKSGEKLKLGFLGFWNCVKLGWFCFGFGGFLGSHFVTGFDSRDWVEKGLMLVVVVVVEWRRRTVVRAIVWRRTAGLVIPGVMAGTTWASL